MRQVLVRAGYVLRRPAVVVVGLLVAAGGVALVRAPLFGLPGYELSLALAIAIGLLGGIPGGTAAYVERRLLQGRDPRPSAALRRDDAASAVFDAIAAGSLVNLVFLVPPLAAATVYAMTSTRCDPFDNAGMIALLPVPSAVLAAAVGAFCGFASRRRLTGALLYLLFVIGSAVATGWPIVYGPQVFAFNHFLGYLPGPLYDEAVSVGAPLAWFRLETLLLAACVWLLAAVLLRMTDGRLVRPHFRPGPLALLVGLGLCAWALEERAPALGFRMDRAFLAEQLGGVRETHHFILTYPRSKPLEDVDRLERDAEFRYAQLSELLGGGPGRKIRVYAYRSAEEKRRLVGAGYTQYAKPWLAELHLNDAAFPHPTLKHELAHVMAAPLGAGPFAVTTRYGVMPVMGIIEGAAVAADDPVDDLTLHQWAAGMRRQGLAPDVRELLGPDGFYKNAPARAYTLAGSFLRYLADTYGSEKLRALYARGDFESTYGRTLPALASEWEKYLDAIPIEQAHLNQAFARFRRGSIFARACAREVAQLQTRSMELLASDPQLALEGFRRIAELQPEEPNYKIAIAAALAKLGRSDEAIKVLAELAEEVKGREALEADVAMAQANLAVKLGQPDRAAPFLEHVLQLPTSPSQQRTAKIKLGALASAVAGPAIWSYLESGGGGDELKLLRLREALDQEPQNAILAYLLGRRLLQGGEPALAAAFLERGLGGELADPIRREATRLALEASFDKGDCAGVTDLAGRLPDLGEPLKRQAAEWVARCEFEQRTYPRLLVPAVGFR